MEIIFWIYFIFTAYYAVSAVTHTDYTFRKRLVYVLFSPLALPVLFGFLIILCIGLLLDLAIGESNS